MGFQKMMCASLIHTMLDERYTFRILNSNLVAFIAQGRVNLAPVFTVAFCLQVEFIMRTSSSVKHFAHECYDAAHFVKRNTLHIYCVMKLRHVNYIVITFYINKPSWFCNATINMSDYNMNIKTKDINELRYEIACNLPMHV